MSDFIAELEAELIAAARRRAARRRRRVHLPRPHRPALLAVAAAALVVVTAIGVTAALRARVNPTGDQSVTPATTPTSGCEKSVTGELLSAVPSLRRPSNAAVPAAVSAAIDEIWTPIPERARVAGQAAGTAFWVVPVMRLGEGERCAPASDACLVPVDGNRAAEDPACTTAGDGLPRVVRYRGRVLAYGLVAPAIREVEIVVDGGAGVVPARDGVVASLLPAGVTMSPRSGVHWRTFGAGRPPVAVLNATRMHGVAGATRDHLVGAGLTTARDVLVANFPETRRRSAVVYDGETFAARARSIAKALDIADVRPAPTEVLELARGAAVVVVLGADRAP
jgi:hypothetical protein